MPRLMWRHRMENSPTNTRTIPSLYPVLICSVTYGLCRIVLFIESFVNVYSDQTLLFRISMRLHASYVLGYMQVPLISILVPKMPAVNNYDEITVYYNDALRLMWNQSTMVNNIIQLFVREIAIFHNDMKWKWNETTRLMAPVHRCAVIRLWIPLAFIISALR